MDKRDSDLSGGGDFLPKKYRFEHEVKRTLEDKVVILLDEFGTDPFVWSDVDESLNGLPNKSDQKSGSVYLMVSDRERCTIVDKKDLDKMVAEGYLIKNDDDSFELTEEGGLLAEQIRKTDHSIP